MPPETKPPHYAARLLSGNQLDRVLSLDWLVREKNELVSDQLGIP